MQPQREHCLLSHLCGADHQKRLPQSERPTTEAKPDEGLLVVYANAITRTEHDEETGEDVERDIPYMKSYAVFNVEQIERSVLTVVRRDSATFMQVRLNPVCLDALLAAG